MALDFRPDTTQVLNYGPRPHTATMRKEWLLWPAYLYRVVAPPVRQRQINCFQKAILGLCRAGETDSAQMAAKLHLDVTLVNLILDELYERKTIGRNRRITEQGQKILSEERYLFIEAAEDQSLRVGYVFQDPWSGALWPRFIENLQHQEIKYRQSEHGARYPNLVLGSKGKPRERRAFVKSGRGIGEPRPPGAIEILKASSDHQRALRRWRPHDNGYEDDFSFDLTFGLLVDRVSIMSEEPEACFLTSFIYIPDDTGRSLDWYVCDPFGFDSSPAFRTSIERQMDQDSHLKEIVNSLLVAVNEANQELHSALQDSEAAARRVLKDELGPLIAGLPYLDHLIGMERSYQETIALSRCPVDKYDDVLVKAGKALEAAFCHIQSKHPANGEEVIYRNLHKDFRRDLLNEYARLLGLNAPIHNLFASASPNDVSRTAERNNGQLKSWVVLALLTAYHNLDHPLRAAAAVHHDLFDKIAELITSRNHNAPAGDRKLNPEKVARLRANYYAILRAILPKRNV